MLVLGGTLRHNPKSHKDLIAWNILSGSLGTLFQSQKRELKTEVSKRAQRKIFNWKRRQQQKLANNTKVLKVRECIRNKLPQKSKSKKRQIKRQKRFTARVTKRPTETIYILEKEKPRIFCLEQRQQSSPAVMIARLRSNRRYKSDV